MSATASALNSDEVYIAVLDLVDSGKLGRQSFSTHGERFLRALVSEPHKIIARLLGWTVEGWIEEEATIVSGLAKANSDEERKAAKQQIPALVPGHFSGEKRNKDECLSRQIIGHDFDRLQADTFEQVIDLVKRELPNRFLAIHTTASERKADGTWCLRVFELLDRAATVAEWDTRVKMHMRSLGAHDPKALDISRLFYMPVRTAGYRFAVIDGPRTRLDSLPIVDSTTTSSTTTSSTTTSSTVPDHIAIARTVAAGALGAAWPATGRHTAQLALAGALRRDGWDRAAALDFVCAVCRVAGDEDRPKREKTIASTWAKSPEDCTGWATVAESVGWPVVGLARQTLNVAAAAMREACRELGIAEGRAANDAGEDAHTQKRIEAAERALRVGGGDVARLTTGLPSIDAATRGGLLLRKVVALGGAPGAGKTAAMVSLAFRWLTAGVHVAFLAADEDADAILIRFGQLSGLDRGDLEKGTPEARAALAAWCRSVPLILADGDDENGTIEIVSKELQIAANGGPSVLFVDSMQTARTEEKAARDADARQKVNVTVRALKHAAKVDGHLVVASSELSKAAYRNRAQAENVNALSAFKESGDIEYGVALAVVLVSRQGTSDLVDAAIVKNRLGPGKPEFLVRLSHDRANVTETNTAEAAKADPLFLVKEEILSYVDEFPNTNQKKTVLANKVGGRRAVALRAINELIEARDLVEETQGVRRPFAGETRDPSTRRRDVVPNT